MEPAGATQHERTIESIEEFQDIFLKIRRQLGRIVVGHGEALDQILSGRVNVTYEDVDRVAVPALNHRLVLNYAALADGVDPRQLIERLVQRARRLQA
jgi:hypothetical protein